MCDSNEVKIRVIGIVLTLRDCLFHACLVQMERISGAYFLEGG